MPELIAAYPNAKIIVCMRDADEWMKSMISTSGVAIRSLSLMVFARLDYSNTGRQTAMFHSLVNGLFGKDFLQHQDHTKEKYLELHEEVRQIVPEDRLLEFQLKQGWAPLCNFLEKDVPEKPFPHVNESAEFNTRMELMGKRTMIRVSKKYLPMFGAAIALAGAWYLLKIWA